MRYLIICLAFSLLTGTAAHCQEVARLAGCATKVFNDIKRSGSWSGKAPAGCPPGARVERRPGGIFVTVWSVEETEGWWIRTSFNAAMNEGEIARPRELARAGRDIKERAARLERCLTSIITLNDPLDCRDRATRSYLVDEESGVETRRLVWLDDDGRHAVVEYGFGSSSATPTPPVDLFSGYCLPPGVTIDLNVRRPHGTRP